MSWRTIVVSKSAKLDYHMGYMVVRQAETTKIFLNEISTVIIETTAVSITGTLMSEFIKNKIKVVFCDEKRNPSSELVPYYGSHDTSAKIRNQMAWNDDIKAIIKSVIGGKITLSMKELLGSWEQNADCFKQGETVSGIVRSVESYGIFVELAPNLAGLAEIKPNVFEGQKTCVYIKSILPDKMKVKLIIIDSFGSDSLREPIKYFIKDGHIDSWKYSPDSCGRNIVSNF